MRKIKFQTKTRIQIIIGTTIKEDDKIRDEMNFFAQIPVEPHYYFSVFDTSVLFFLIVPCNNKL